VQGNSNPQGIADPPLALEMAAEAEAPSAVDFSALSPSVSHR
jgi:hypothetical protein